MGLKRTHRFTRPGGGWLWIARIWEDSAKLGACFSMVTTRPNALVEPIHNLMPAVLADDQLAPYLAGDIRGIRPAAGDA